MLSKEESSSIHKELKRSPTISEELVLDALWSEHCSYKSSKRWFHLFHTESPRLILGIGEGAGLLDVGDGYVIGLGLESHNHPSAVDPFNGAATGVGGIIRDILSQGCRPIAILDCLRFGYPVENRQKLLLDQVVLGISSYGNCVGVPNLGGDLEFAEEFTGNPLINAMCVGVVKKEDIIRSIADNPGDLLLLFGATTGRDGIGGVTFASEELDDQQQESRGSVQIGDPLTEKLLIDAVIQLRDRKLLHGLQDLGGGGLCCAAAEMSEKGKSGVSINLDKIPVREENMKAWELLISESQERMLGIIPEINLDKATKILDDLELTWAVIGKITDDGRFKAKSEDELVVDLPIDLVINGFPEPVRNQGLVSTFEEVTKKDKNLHPLIELLSSFTISSKECVYQQYDQHVQGNTVISPGRDAGVLYLPNGKFLAISAGTNSYMCSRDPRNGAALSTLAVLRSIVARGAEPIGLVDSINAGNPEKAESYTEFVEMLKQLLEEM
ncbi:MAG: phosphoribosylformylglycinamidine synthase subunit PurL [Candidatus Kariarchaeaceae archaeon]|jgi:phosphoribosylformylglycinamidine synthase